MAARLTFAAHPASDLSKIKPLTVYMSFIIYLGTKLDVDNNLILPKTARAAGPMRDQFLDELGGVHVPPQSSKGERAVEDCADGHLNEISNWSDGEGQRRPADARSAAWPWVVGAAVIALAAVFWVGFSDRGGGQTSSSEMPPPQVTVSKPLARDVDTRIGFLGQFSAIDRVELRAQVGGPLTEIHFQDGQIVHKGDLLFMIDPRPYEIKLAKATAQLQTASARFALASVQFVRAQTLLRTSFGTAETVDQRTSEQSSAQAAIDDAKAQMRDAQLDIEYCRITAPFPGRIGGASGLSRKLDCGQPRRNQPDHPADDTRLARSYLSRFRHERIRLSNLFP